MADEIKTCRELDEHLAPYVDGEEPPAARRSVESHLAACPPCLEHAEAETAARKLVRDHREDLRVGAPPELRARCAALESLVARRHSTMSTLRRWVLLSLAATLVLAVYVGAGVA